MPTEMGIWRIDGEHPQRLTEGKLPLESMLETFLANDPTLLGEALMVIGRQVRTPHNTFIDLLAIDEEGALHVLELKRDKTPRDVVAQLLDYGSWVSTLSRDQVVSIAEEHLNEAFEPAYTSVFETPVPDELGISLRLTVVASSFDPSSERIVSYLRDFGVPINAVFFSFHEDEGRRYLARSWLASDEEAASGSRTASRTGRSQKTEPWNGVDWYVNFGDGPGRSWGDGQRYGFVSAGGGDWYSRTLRNLPVGARVNVYLPGRGYVAVGTTLRPAAAFDEGEVLVDGEWRLLATLPLDATYEHDGSGGRSGDLGEYVVPMEWIASVPTAEAYRVPGMFASTHSACKLRQNFTLERIARHFGLYAHETGPSD